MNSQTNVKQFQMYINGEFVNASSGEVIQVLNPATENVISEVPSCSKVEVQEAIEFAEVAQKRMEKETGC